MKKMIIEYVRDSLEKKTGNIYAGDLRFTFSITKIQKKNKKEYSYRGLVSARGTDQFIMVCTRQNKLGEQKQVKVQKEVYFKSAEKEDINKKLLKGVEGLFIDYPEIFSAPKSEVRKEVITGYNAAIRYAEEFVNANTIVGEDNGNKKRREDKKDILLSFFSNYHLFVTPINQVTEKDIIKIIKVENQNKNVKLIRDFFQFLIEKKQFALANPIPKSIRQDQKKHKRLSRSIHRIELLTFAQEQDLYEKLIEENSEVSVAVALCMGAGIRTSKIIELVWDDIIFVRPGFVIVKIFINCNRATRDYSHPVAPIAAEIIENRYRFLCEKYGKETVSKMPVVGEKRNPARKTSKQNLENKIKRAMSDYVSKEELALISTENLDESACNKILNNTYDRDLREYCNLENDPWTYKFLKMESLAFSISADSYVSFSSYNALEHLHNILSCLSRYEESYDSIKTMVQKDEEDKSTIFEFVPRSNKDYIEIVGSIEVSDADFIQIEEINGTYGYISEIIKIQ